MKIIIKIFLLAFLLVLANKSSGQGFVPVRYCLDGGNCVEIIVGYFNGTFDQNGNLIATNFTGVSGWEEQESLKAPFLSDEYINGNLNASILTKLENGCPLVSFYRRRFHMESGFYIDEFEVCEKIDTYSSSFPLPRPIDDDMDGIFNSEDNCPFDPNPNQEDNDFDNVGDVCDPDDDNDDVMDAFPDNCQFMPNSLQKDTDLDLQGDACDPDDDGDDIDDSVDNCPWDPNPAQENIDSHLDNDGDACDPDSDSDNISDDDDNCPSVPNTDQADNDSDLNGDLCDFDDDNDTVLDDSDNCPFIANSDQSDIDLDGVGDLCDLDTDSDDINDQLDNCPLNQNPDQSDKDGDGIGDACDLVDDSELCFPIVNKKKVLSSGRHPVAIICL